MSNPRHRRSQSAGGELWLDHRPANPVELGTVMQPLMKRRKSVTKLTDAKDVANSKTSKYCLMTQEQDSSGELETRLYKVICLFVSQCISNPYKPLHFTRSSCKLPCLNIRNM